MLDFEGYLWHKKSVLEKDERSQTCDLRFYFKKLEKESKTNPKQAGEKNL